MRKYIAAALIISLSALMSLQPSAGQNPAKPVIEKAKHSGYTEAFAGDPGTEAKDTSAKFDMVAIPGGTFLMGSPESEKERGADEGPQHWVAIRPFWMGKTEVTWDEYEIYQKEMGVEHPDVNDKILKANPDAFTGPTPPYVDQYYGHGASGHPALCMTNHAANQYCRWLSKKTGKTYRLPTEAEWEYACRAGTTTAYFFGDDPKDLHEYAWYIKNAPHAEGEDPKTHKVATRKPNPWGLYDMAGNVMEWCLDQYARDYYKMMPLDRPILGPILMPTEKRFSNVARGGSWNDQAPVLRSAARVGSTKEWIKTDPQRPQSIWWLTLSDFVGFRVVRPVEEQENLKGFRSKVMRKSPD
jgi:formylglycine-generating enzyme required for sulfatase activity